MNEIRARVIAQKRERIFRKAGEIQEDYKIQQVYS